MKKKVEKRDVRAYIEKWGVLFELLGSTRTAGKILGWLLVCDPPHQTAKEIAGAICASIASVSTATRTLTQAAFIERVGISGKRSAHFRVTPGMWAQLLRTRIGRVASMRHLAEEGLTLFPKADSDATLRLREILSYCAFVEKEFPVLIARWEEEWRRENL